MVCHLNRVQRESYWKLGPMGEGGQTPADVFWKENWQVLMMEGGAGERGETQRAANISRLISRIIAWWWQGTQCGTLF